MAKRPRFYSARMCSAKLAALAAEAGISADAMRMQRDRSVAAIRRLLEAA